MAIFTVSGDTAAEIGGTPTDDRYVIDAFNIDPGQQLLISDTQGANTLHLIGGLDISASAVTADALLLTLSNDAQITLLGADAFDFQTGGNGVNGIGGQVTSFATFVTDGLGLAEVPTGSTAVSGGAVIVDETGGTTADPVDTDGSGGESEEGLLVDLSGQTEVVAEDGVPETFVLEFDSSSGNALSSDAVVSITGFDPAEDILRFDDANAPAQDAATFLSGAGGAAVFSNGFDGETIIGFQDDNTADSMPPAQVSLVGITDTSLGGADPFFEVV